MQKQNPLVIARICLLWICRDMLPACFGNLLTYWMLNVLNLQNAWQIKLANLVRLIILWPNFGSQDLLCPLIVGGATIYLAPPLLGGPTNFGGAKKKKFRRSAPIFFWPPHFWNHGDATDNVQLQQECNPLIFYQDVVFQIFAVKSRIYSHWELLTISAIQVYMCWWYKL